jgi:hypothetical protein
MHSFGPEMKRTYPIHVFGPNSDVLVRFGQFRYCAKNHAGVAFNALIRAINETMRNFGPETKRTHPIHFFDLIVMFWFVSVSFVTVQKTMLGLHLMHRFEPLTKRRTVSAQK